MMWCGSFMFQAIGDARNTKATTLRWKLSFAKSV